MSAIDFVSSSSVLCLSFLINEYSPSISASTKVILSRGLLLANGAGRREHACLRSSTDAGRLCGHLADKPPRLSFQ